jgi:hypothetical protein
VARIFYPAARAILHVVFDDYDADTDAERPEYVLPITPKSATVHCNSYRQADSYELTFDAADLPLDPQLVRSGMAEIFLFELKPGMRAEHMVQSRLMATLEERQAGRPQSSLAALEASDRSEGGRKAFTVVDEPRICGLFDEQGIEMSEDGRWVTISGQDYTAWLTAKQWPPTAGGQARKIPLGKRLDKTLEDILDQADPSGRLTLKVEPADMAKTLPVVGAAEAATNGRGIPVEQNTSYWDVMYKLATRYACILFVRNLDVVLARPKNLDERAVVNAVHLAWGHNIAHLSLKRHFGLEKVPRIELHGYDTRSRKTVIVSYPAPGAVTQGSKKDPVLKNKAKKTARTKVLPRSGLAPQIKDEDNYQIIPVWGHADRVELMRAAETLYHLLGHAERQLVAVTHDLADLSAEPQSMLTLNVGDAVEVSWQLDRELLIGMSDEERFSYLVRRGYGPDIAQVIARHFTQLVGQQRPMRVHEVTYEFSVDAGLSIEVALSDFVVVDGQRQPQPGGEQM